MYCIYLNLSWKVTYCKGLFALITKRRKNSRKKHGITSFCRVTLAITSKMKWKWSTENYNYLVPALLNLVTCSCLYPNYLYEIYSDWIILFIFILFMILKYIFSTFLKTQWSPSLELFGFKSNLFYYIIMCCWLLLIMDVHRRRNIDSLRYSPTWLFSAIHMLLRKIYTHFGTVEVYVIIHWSFGTYIHLTSFLNSLRSINIDIKWCLSKKASGRLVGEISNIQTLILLLGSYTIGDESKNCKTMKLGN